MIQSMTGYHKLSFDHASKTIHIEIKSLNSKHADISMCIPPEYKEKELTLRELIKQYLKRGKIEYTIYMDKHAHDDTGKINKTAFTSYYRQLKDISENENIPMDPNIMQVISRMPDIMKQEKKKLSDKEWECILFHTKSALENVVQYRINEGHSMYKDIKASAENIITLLTKIKPFKESRIENTRQRLLTNLDKLQNKTDYDDNRFEQELAYYLEKLDINEEEIRLKSHCNYFLETIENEEMAGKKLGFITQEMGREINTLGSKANDMNIQKIVVEMKEELEKIKEMILNVL